MDTGLIGASVGAVRSSPSLSNPSPLDCKSERRSGSGDRSHAQSPYNQIVTGVITSVAGRNEATVEVAIGGFRETLRVRTTVPLGTRDVSRRAVVAFEQGDRNRPIVLGLMLSEEDSNKVNVEVDGERVVLAGSREVVLRCGGASITLTKAGKVLIQGEYVSTRSKGANRIKGASVQIN
jgi:hypothetical protein